MSTPPDSTLWNVATGHGQTCIEELRLSADNALRENWEHGRALHTLIDALEGAPINEDTREAFDSFASEFDEGCPDVLQSFDDSVTDLESNIETLFDNALSDLITDGPTPKNVERMFKRMREAVNDVMKIHKTAREPIQDLHRNLLSVCSDLKDKLKENQ